MDTFDKKREMVRMLMDMLKHNASDEVSGTGDTSGHPHMADLTKTNELQQRTSDSAKMAEGGLAGTDMDASDEPNRLLEPKGPADDNQDETAISLLPGKVEDEETELDSLQTTHDEDMMDEDEDNNSSSFQAFLPRKKKK